MNKVIVSYYLQEILQRIYYYIWSFLCTTSLLYFFSYELLYLLVLPYKRNFIFTESSELFTQIIFLNFFFAFLINLPYAFYQLCSFFLPLIKKSKKKIYFFLGFFGGCFYFFFLLLFFMIYIQIFHFFLEQRVETFLYTIHSEIRIHSLLQNIQHIFFFPIPFFFLFYLKKYIGRKYSWIGIILFVSFFIPPDPFTQLYITFFLLFFYEIVSFLGFLKNRLFSPE